ncbi:MULTISPECIES: 2-hydroxychromene-2-carboxylate isomerase [Streptomyces]|uniref:2-hydroxychromene-2-carboxylate isomerase n=1 Tax=Streptomyces TaxID=1883 RepID=UPI00163C1BC9|nr:MULTISPECIES: DsbA family protein [Streptomyces]MBC2875749.1 DsbA family protein [Streptomyces sp. TYQ1024]UBI37602.1 DsbA family protein [Streptomyces mobaraensis]UKW30190.1 DsbA family protein [Streptomyces sp. TYQ1024]
MRKPPRLYFSLRSPFSWMAVRLLEEHRPDAHELIEYIPFFEPDPQTMAALTARGGEFHYVAMSKAKHLYILSDTKRLAAKFGFPMKWPIDTGDEWWELPHLAWIKAKELGIHREYYEAVMAARWGRGEDICDRERLLTICRAAGLDGATLVAAPDDPAMREKGVEALMRVYEDDVFGVPYFTSGRHRFWGLDRLADFEAALDQAPPATTSKE